MAYPPITIADSTQHAPAPDGGLALLVYQGFFTRTTGSQVPSGRATGNITTVAVASLVDGETFTIDDGTNPPSVFEFDVLGNGVTGGRVSVDVSGDTTADDVRDTIIAAINGNITTTLNITASSGGSGTVLLVNDNAGAAGNTTSAETVTDGTFAITDMTGGTGPFFSFDAVTLEATSDINMDFPQVANPETVRVLPQFRFSAALHHVGRAFLETAPFLEKREVIRFY